ncbi:curculin domain-containing protein [Nakamurella flava]|uniref:Curculin domain-containing protein n=1 Tax=Nakamurella flava TaxID=2576308 RepID=A0A4V6Y6S9_9ACTN|nr:curculin domain-containing protein [Nakamurella flava]TKV60705.1 curculin domain-containing protein [Nakamurella flava]
MTTTSPSREASGVSPARRGGVRALLVATVVALTAAGALPATAAPAQVYAAPALTAAAASSGDTLGAGGALAAGEVLTSSNGQYRAAMQTDGNFVVYGPKGPLWWTGTNKGASSFVAMQTDGNLVVYSGGAASRPLWATYSVGSNARLVIQDDGNLVIYSGERPLWSRLTGNFRYDVLAPGKVLLPGYGLISLNGMFTAAMQEDGNFVVYGPGDKVLYTTNTGGAIGAYLVMRSSGTASLYNKQGSILGSLGGDVPGSCMVMQNDGNLVIYTKGGRATWWSR